MKKCSSIVLIDDNSIDNLVNSELIKELDISESILIMEDGIKGITYLRQLGLNGHPPSLIFLDLNMPHFNGFDFMQELNSFPSEFRQEVKVIVLTSSLNESDFEEAKNCGCDGYLIKPLTTEMIMDEFEKVFYYE